MKTISYGAKRKMCEQSQNTKSDCSESARPIGTLMDNMKNDCEKRHPNKRILWLVLKKHTHWIEVNTGRLADLCYTHHTEFFNFFRDESFFASIYSFYDTAFKITMTSKKLEKQMTEVRPRASTKVEIRLIDSSEGIRADLYPQMDIVIVDRGKICEMIKNEFGELKKFSWEHNRIRTEKEPRFSDFIPQKNNKNN